MGPGRDCGKTALKIKGTGQWAELMELADMQDLGSCAARRMGSSPIFRSRFGAINMAEKPYLSHFSLFGCAEKCSKNVFLQPTFSVFSSFMRFCSFKYREKQ